MKAFIKTYESIIRRRGGRASLRTGRTKNKPNKNKGKIQKLTLVRVESSLHADDLLTAQSAEDEAPFVAGDG